MTTPPPVLGRPCLKCGRVVLRPYVVALRENPRAYFCSLQCLTNHAGQTWRRGGKWKGGAGAR